MAKGNYHFGIGSTFTNGQTMSNDAVMVDVPRCIALHLHYSHLSISNNFYQVQFWFPNAETSHFTHTHPKKHRHDNYF